MRPHHLVGFLFVSLVAFHSFAEEAATPKATMGMWTKDGASWNLDQLYTRIFDAHGEKEVKLARAMAEQTLIVCKLQVAVRAKWGKEAETAFARTVVTDTLEDDEGATENVASEHATVTFKEETQLPVTHLIKINGEWKTDVGFTVRDLGDQYDTSFQFYRKTAKVLQAAMDGLTANEYKNSADLDAFLKVEYEKITQ